MMCLLSHSCPKSKLGMHSIINLFLHFNYFIYLFRPVYFQIVLYVEIPELSYTYSHRFCHLHSWTVLLQHPQNCLLDSDTGGPPQNIRAWMKFMAICCQVRYVTIGLIVPH